MLPKSHACLALGSIHILPTFPHSPIPVCFSIKGQGLLVRAFTALTVTSVYNNPSGPAATSRCPFTPRCFQRPPQLVCLQPHHSQRPHVFDFSFRREESCFSCTWQTVCDHRLSDPVKRLRDPALPGTPCSSLLCSQRLLLSLGPQLAADTSLGSLPYHFSAAGSEPCWPYHFP